MKSLEIVLKGWQSKAVFLFIEIRKNVVTRVFLIFKRQFKVLGVIGGIGLHAQKHVVEVSSTDIVPAQAERKLVKVSSNKT